MKLFPFAAVVCMAAFPALFVLADDGPARTIPELTLEERIVDLLETIQDEAPEIYRRMAELPREEALARIMRALDSGVIPASAAASGSGRQGMSVARQGGQVRSYPVLELTEKKFLYVRFDALTQESASQAHQDLEKKTVNETHPGRPGDPLRSVPAGVIVDLREADGGQYDRAAFAAEAVKFTRPCPVMVLVSGKTKGAGELLAALLRRDREAVLIGTETAGSIFPVKRITVNDVGWFVPTPGPDDAGISPYALKPDLEKKSDARLSYDELKEKPDKLDGDPVLRLAADLLTMKTAVKPAEGQSPAQ